MTSTPRHPATQHLLDQFGYEHLPPSLQAVFKPISELKDQMAELLADGPELSVGLRKLIEAKDCLVRQRVADLKAAGEPAPVNTPERAITHATSGLDLLAPGAGQAAETGIQLADRLPHPPER